MPIYLQEGGAANCGGPICLSMLAGRRAADKEGLDRLFGPNGLFASPSSDPKGGEKDHDGWRG